MTPAEKFAVAVFAWLITFALVSPLVSRLWGKR